MPVVVMSRLATDPCTPSARFWTVSLKPLRVPCLFHESIAPQARCLLVLLSFCVALYLDQLSNNALFRTRLSPLRYFEHANNMLRVRIATSMLA